MLSPCPLPDTLSVPEETLKRKTEKVKGTPETGHETQYQGNGIASLSRKGWSPGGTWLLVQRVWGADNRIQYVCADQGFHCRVWVAVMTSMNQAKQQPGTTD